MTDLLGYDTDPGGSEDTPVRAPASESPAKQCAYPGCSEPALKREGNRGRPPTMCAEHAPVKRERVKPASVTVNIRPPASRVARAEKELAEVEARAHQLMQVAAALVLIIGHEGDAQDMANGAEQWAKAVRGLAEHEAWVRKLAAGGEASARTIAWIQFAVATGAILVPILIRHKALPKGVSQALGTVMGLADEMRAQQAADQGNDQPPGMEESIRDPEPAVA